MNNIYMRKNELLQMVSELTLNPSVKFFLSSLTRVFIYLIK